VRGNIPIRLFVLNSKELAHGVKRVSRRLSRIHGVGYVCGKALPHQKDFRVHLTSRCAERSRVDTEYYFSPYAT
jgi:hypothetical protein